MADFPDIIDLSKLQAKIEQEKQEEMLKFDDAETVMSCPSCDNEDFNLYWDGTIKCSYCDEELALIVDVDVLHDEEM